MPTLLSRTGDGILLITLDFPKRDVVANENGTGTAIQHLTHILRRNDERQAARERYHKRSAFENGA